MTFGSRGTYTNLGIPGTGLYSRERIDTNPRPHGSDTRTITASVSVSDDGAVTFMGSDGQPLNDHEIKVLKEQNKDKLQDLMAQAAEEINGHLEALETIHHSTPRPDLHPKFEERPFAEPKPIRVPLQKYGFIGRFFRTTRDRIDKANAQANEQFREDSERWEASRQLHLLEEQKRKRMLEELVLTDTNVMEDVLDASLQELSWPRETEVSAEVFEDGRVVMVDVDLPEIEDMPHRTARVPQRGYKLSIKDLAKTRLQQLYMRHVHGVGFRIVGEVFYVLPRVERVVLSAYTQRPDKSTGVIQDDFIYSVKVNRGEWGRIDFGNLVAVDPVDALGTFELRRDLSKTGIFKLIQPFHSQDW